MTQKDKELLLKDLYARLPYNPFIKIGENPRTFKLSQRVRWICSYGHIENMFDDIKPYLRPVSSMTEEEMDKLFDILQIDKDGEGEDWIKINDVMGIKFFLPTGRWMEEVDEALAYLRSIHIDIYNFIGKKVALEAPEGMYKQIV